RESVSNQFNELCQLGILDGTEITYIDKVEPPHPIRVWSQVGRRLTAVTTALGRAILASTEVNRQELSRFAPPAKVTEEEKQRSWDAIVHARLNGYSIEEEDSEPGIGCVSVAILKDDRPIAAVSITMPIERLQPQLESAGRRLRDIAARELPTFLRIPDTL